MSSTTGYESPDEACPLDLLSVSGLESNRTFSSSAIRWSCPECGVRLPAVVKEIAKLREAVERLETKNHEQYMINLKQSHYCRDLESRCDAAERGALSREQGEAKELHALKESNAKLKEELTMTVKKCKDLKERLHEGEKNCKQLRDVLAKAFCKSKLSPTEMHKVIIQQIPNNQEHIRTWIDFLNPLEMPQNMVCSEKMSPWDAKGNVCHVLLAWLDGKGSPGKPRTWGTLLDAMHRGCAYLQQLANRAEYTLLEELASLKMDFHLCVKCRKKILQDSTAETDIGWVEDGVVQV